MIPNLTPAQLERLALLAEELGEAQQAIGKILRHGYESHNPDAEDAGSNRQHLGRECGHVTAALDLLVAANDLEFMDIEGGRNAKHDKLYRWMHHQPESLLRRPRGV